MAPVYWIDDFLLASWLDDFLPASWPLFIG